MSQEKLMHIVITHGISCLPVLPAPTPRKLHKSFQLFDSNLNVLQICPDFLPPLLVFLLLLMGFSSGKVGLLEFQKCEE